MTEGIRMRWKERPFDDGEGFVSKRVRGHSFFLRFFSRSFSSYKLFKDMEGKGEEAPRGG